MREAHAARGSTGIFYVPCWRESDPACLDCVVAGVMTREAVTVEPGTRCRRGSLWSGRAISIAPVPDTAGLLVGPVSRTALPNTLGELH